MTPAAGTVLLAVLALATVASITVASRRGAGRRMPGTAAATAGAAVLLALAGTPGPGALPSLAAVLAACLLYVTHQGISEETLRTPRLTATLDALSGLALATALACALGTGAVRAATGVGPATASLLLARPAAAALLVLIAAVFLGVGGTRTDARMNTLRAALLALVVAEAARLLGVLAPPGSPEAVAGDRAALAARALALAVLLLATTRPAPPRGRAADEDVDALVVGTVAVTVVSVGLLVLAAVVALPVAAVGLAAVAVLLTTVRTVLVFSRITSLNADRHQARTDDLTGLGNRRALLAGLEQVGAAQGCALVLVDLDGFKAVNDTHGHAVGDALLRQVATRLLVGCRAGDLVTRQGGDEFALVLPGTDAVGAARRAAALVEAVRAPVDLDGRRLVVAASVGVASAPRHASTSEALLRCADAAMYRAKAAGGGVVVFDPEDDRARRADALLAQQLRDAVEQELLDVHYQPQVDARGRLAGVEALVRWQHPVLGPLLPDAFLPLAERDGLVGALTAQVLRRALADLALLRARAGAAVPRVSVNVCASSVADPALVATVVGALTASGTPARSLVLEITETSLMVDPATSRAVADELVGLGVGVSVDDYGTGHSTLAYLKDLPVAELKLDRSFVADLADVRTTVIVRTTVDLAHSLGLRLVAEGVEDASTLARLRALGVDTTQGHHHCRPLPVEELVGWVRALPPVEAVTGPPAGGVLSPAAPAVPPLEP